MSDTTPNGGTGSSRLAGVVDTSTYTGQWAVVAERFAGPDRVSNNLRWLTHADRPESTVHDYLIVALLELGEAHTNCTDADCPTCFTLTKTVSMIVAEHEIRQGRVPGAAYAPLYPDA